jgi:hypothetical protein
MRAEKTDGMEKPPQAWDEAGKRAKGSDARVQVREAKIKHFNGHE